MRILVTYPADRLTGAARYAAGMSLALQRRGHDVCVAVHGQGPATNEFSALGRQHIKAINLPNLRRNFGDATRHAAGLVTGTRSLMKLMDDFRPDVVIGHCVFNVWTAAAAAAKSVPFVAVVHEMPFSFPSVLYQAWKTLLNATASTVVVVSDEMKSAFASSPLPSAKCVVIPPGVDTAVFHPGVNGKDLRAQWQQGTDGPVVVCVSHLMPAKGQADVIEALPKVKELLPNVRLVFVGGTNDVVANQRFAEHLRRRVDELSLAPNVLFVGERADTATVFAAADVVVCPSHGESFGLVALEACAVGRAVVATSVGVAPALHAAGAPVDLVDTQRPDALAQAILAACRRGPVCAFVQRQWTMQGAVDQFETLLADTLAAGRATSKFSITK